MSKTYACKGWGGVVSNTSHVWPSDLPSRLHGAADNANGLLNACLFREAAEAIEQLLKGSWVFEDCETCGRQVHAFYEPTIEHSLYKTGDAGAPTAIQDRNGEVVLDQCRVCGRAEAELSDPCTSQGKGRAQLTDEMLKAACDVYAARTGGVFSWSMRMAIEAALSNSERTDG